MRCATNLTNGEDESEQREDQDQRLTGRSQYQSCGDNCAHHEPDNQSCQKFHLVDHMHLTEPFKPSKTVEEADAVPSPRTKTNAAHSLSNQIGPSPRPFPPRGR